MSSKTKSTPPPPVERVAPIRKPEPPPALKGLVRRRLDTEDRTFLRPRSAMAIESFLPKPKTPAMMPTPYMALKPQPIPPPAPVHTRPLPEVKGAHRDLTTDPRFEVPAAVITQRTRILPPKQTWSWGAALIGLGIAAGLASAIVARGDADSLLDATARIVDPSGTHAAGATPQTIAPLAMAAAAATTPATTPGFASTPVMMMGAQPAVQTAAQPVAIAPPPKLPDPSLAKPEPPRPAPVAWAAPVRHAQVQHASQQAAAQPAPQPAAAAAPPAPRPAQQQVAAAKPAPASKGAPAPKGNEMESASAADALAKAQLEASLR
jgi:hypothetical protein